MEERNEQEANVEAFDCCFDPSLLDCILRADDGFMAANRSILAWLSPEFKELLEGGQMVITFQGIKEIDISNMLRLIYKGSKTLVDPTNFKDFKKATEMMKREISLEEAEKKEQNPSPSTTVLSNLKSRQSKLVPNLSPSTLSDPHVIELPQELVHSLPRSLPFRSQFCSSNVLKDSNRSVGTAGPVKAPVKRRKSKAVKQPKTKTLKRRQSEFVPKSDFKVKRRTAQKENMREKVECTICCAVLNNTKDLEVHINRAHLSVRRRASIYVSF